MDRPILERMVEHARRSARTGQTANREVPDTRRRTGIAPSHGSRRRLLCGGCCQADNRNVGAFEILFDSRLAKPSPKPLPIGLPAFWGVPNIMKRLLLGADERLVPDLMKSGKWTGTEAYLNTILQNYYLKQSLMPIRDGIDFVHAGIFSTIKGLKFSNLSQVCGGSIEIAVITSDRPFRWVRHKRFDEKPVGNGAISSATIAHGSICRNVRAFQAARMVLPTRPTASFGRPA